MYCEKGRKRACELGNQGPKAPCGQVRSHGRAEAIIEIGQEIPVLFLLKMRQNEKGIAFFAAVCYTVLMKKGGSVVKQFWSVLLILVLLTGCAPKEEMAQKTLFCMDTVMDLQVWGEDSQAAVEDLTNMLFDLEKTWSVTDENSFLCQLNRGQSKPDGEQAALLRKAEDLQTRTDGAFNPKLHKVVSLWGFYDKNYRVPTAPELAAALGQEAWDLGAVMKGYAALRCTQILDRYDVTRAILNLGGNIQTYGQKADGSAWKIGVQNPMGEGYVGTLSVEGTMAAVTSGDYQRNFTQDGKLYHHILDPETGMPADKGLASVTVICADGTVADALSTALFVMGLEAGSAFWKNSSDFEAVFVLKDGSIYATEGAPLSGCQFEVISREN